MVLPQQRKKAQICTEEHQVGSVGQQRHADDFFCDAQDIFNIDYHQNGETKTNSTLIGTV